MRVLFATVSPAAYMAPPRLSDEQINCGPEWPDALTPEGKVRSLATPLGEYDLALVAAKLPTDQQPDLIVCLVDASWRNVPRNLQAFRCPRVLLVADTHHMSSPILGMLRYASTEPYDRIVLLYDRHHARIFQSAGFQNLYWFPGLTFPHEDSVVRAARGNRHRAPRIAFVGQAGKHHPRRARIMEALAARKLPLQPKAAGQAEALNFYGSSLLGLNCSLNGDLNLRVVEILSSGAVLLTDRLAQESGLELLLKDGKEMIAYGSTDELIERASDAIAHPAETQEIGAAGARWFDQHLGAARRRALFQKLAFDGMPVPEFALPTPDSSRVFFQGDTDRLLDAVMVYEDIQELHRTQETVTASLDEKTPADIVELYSTLPRVELRRTATSTDLDLGIISRDTEHIPTATRLWCWDGKPQEVQLRAKLEPLGFALAHSAVAVFKRTRPAEGIAQQPVAGPSISAKPTVRSEVVDGPRKSAMSDRMDGVLLLALVASRAGDRELSREMLGRARRMNAADSRLAATERTLAPTL
jgi:hypothetical protein